MKEKGGRRKGGPARVPFTVVASVVIAKYNPEGRRRRRDAVPEDSAAARRAIVLYPKGDCFTRVWSYCSIYI